jgi:hypothetical protein
MSSTEHEKWLFGQLQNYVQSLLDASELDRQEFEDKAKLYRSNITSFRDKVLGGIGVLLTISLGLASMDIFRTYFLILIVGLVAGAITCYVIADVILFYSSFTFFKIKAARWKPIMGLLAMKESLILTSLVRDDEVKLNHSNLFSFIKLVGLAKFELLQELKLASSNWRLLTEKYRYKSQLVTEEVLMARTLDVYEANKSKLLNDELVKFYDEQISYTFGGETVLQMYERFSSARKPSEFHDESHGFRVTLPLNWRTEELSPAIKKLERHEPTIVSTHPISEFNDVTFSVTSLDISNHSIFPTKSLDEIVKYKIDYIGNVETDAQVIENSSIIIGGYQAKKIVYSVRYESLTDKGIKIWVVVNKKAYQIKFEASNELKFDYYQKDLNDILESIKF